MLGFFFDIRLRFQEGFCPDKLGLLASRLGIQRGFGLPQGFFYQWGILTQSQRGRLGFWGALEKGGARVMRELRGEWGVMGEGWDESKSVGDFVGRGFQD